MILLVIFLILLLLAAVFPRSRPLTIAIGLFMLFVYAIPWHEGDLEIYRWVYGDLLTGQFYAAYEPGFIGLMWLCRIVGLPFTGFRLVLGMIIVGTVYGFVRRQTEYSAVALALYGLFPFFMFSSVMRSGIASVFILLAIEQLMAEESSVRRYVIFILLATLFHYSSVLFLPYLLFTGRVKKRNLILVFAGMSLLTILINYTNVVYAFVSRFTQREKILTWLARNDATANTKGIIAILILLAAVYLLNRNSMRQNADFLLEDYFLEDSRSKQIQVSYQLSIYMLFLLPLMVLASPIMRVPYIYFLVFIISSVNAVYREVYAGTEAPSGVVLISVPGLALLFTVLMWKFYADLPYLKGGAHLFTEFIDARFLW